MTTAQPAFFAQDRSFISPEMYDAFFSVIDRLETTLAKETEALAAQRTGEIAEYTRQKRQSFLELNRIMRSMEHTIPSQDVLTRLTSFRAKLEMNDAMLRRQMRALQEVTDIIVRVMQDVESDGTYSRGYGGADWNTM